MSSITGMHRWRLTLIVVLLGLAAPATALAGTAPTLGLKQADTNWGAGFGVARPSAINFNGDPTSFIRKIRWSSWGGNQAVGHGSAGFVWPGFAVADGTRYVSATVVAFDLGTCDGHPAYQREEWYFPQYGETFAEASAGWNICTGKLLSSAPRAGPVYCPKGQFTTWVSGSVTCAELPGIEALVASAAHQGRSAKWISHGWICGTDLNMGTSPQTVDCQSGNSKGVNFKI
ncbi:MAG TPA: hypothetical protein VGI50_04835 [Solirubrobacteraceae bacterium]